MTTNATTTATPSALLSLLRVFDATSLGEGDLGAGANVLAAKAISLTNLYPPGTCLITAEGNRLLVGMSFAAVGGFTESLVSEKVLDPIARTQNNLGDHLAADAAHEANKLAALPPCERDRIRPAEPTNTPELANLRTAIRGVMDPRDDSCFASLLGADRSQGVNEFVSKPAVFLDANSPGDLMKQLAQAHLRHPFVRAVLADGCGTEQLEKVLLSLIRGTSLPTGVTGPNHIRGHVAAACTPARLAQAVEAGEGSLLCNLLCLVDDGCGLPPLPARASEDPSPYRTQANYPRFLRAAWVDRLDYRRTVPRMIRYDWEPRQHEWVAFLRNLEPRCPGLTAAARPLFVTLFYGLFRMSMEQKEEQPRWGDTSVLDLAKFLVGRQVQYRERLVQTEQGTRVLELAIKLVAKLEGGPLDARGIVRKTSRLSTDACREALGAMVRVGVIRGVGDGKWELALPAAQAVKKIRSPYIDV